MPLRSFTFSLGELSQRLLLITTHFPHFALSYLLAYPCLWLFIWITGRLWPPPEQQAIKHEKQHTDNSYYQTRELPCWDAHVWLTLCFWWLGSPKRDARDLAGISPYKVQQLVSSQAYRLHQKGDMLGGASMCGCGHTGQVRGHRLPHSMQHLVGANIREQ